MCNRVDFFGIFFLDQILSQNLKVIMMKHVVIITSKERRGGTPRPEGSRELKNK
jgi:hypothetical protein